MTGKLFPVGGPVSREDVVDREEFIEHLLMRLSEGQSVMLAGPRRIGKTSLAFEVLRRLEERGFYTAAVDLFRVGSKRDFATALIESCLANCLGKRSFLRSLGEGVKKLAGSLGISGA